MKTVVEVTDYRILQLVHVLSFFCSLLTSIAIAFLFAWRQERDSAIEQMTKRFLQQITADTAKAFEEGLLSVTFRTFGGAYRREIGQSLYTLFSRYIEKNRTYEDDYFYAKAVVLNEVLDGLQDNLGELSTKGIKVNVRGHLRVSRALAVNAPVYMQVQTKLSLTPDKWTEEWKKFVDHLSVQPLIRKYILVGSAEDFQNCRSQVKAVSDYLKSKHFYVGVCDRKHLADALGADELTNQVIEFFGNEIIKEVSPYQDQYEGGNLLQMVITTQRTDPRRHKYLVLVDAYECGI